MQAVETLVLAKLVKEKTLKEIRPSVAPGKYPVDMQVNIKGTMKVGEDSEYIPTVHIPMKATLAFLLKRMGFQRDAAVAMLAEAMKEALNSNEESEEAIAALATVAESEKMVTEMLGSLPKAKKQGMVTTDLKVTILD